MTYIALPEGHDPKTGKAIAYAILRHENGQNIPVGFLHEDQCPVPIQLLAENLAAILNGHEPLHKIQSSQRIFYQKVGSGFELRFTE